VNNNELFSNIVRFEKGDRIAFDSIYNDLKTPVYTVAFRILLNQNDAEDVTQDVFIKLFRNPTDFAVENSRAWLFRVAHNLAVDTVRKRKDSVDLEDGASAETETDFDAIAVKMDIDKAFEGLNFSQREVVALHIYGGMTFSDIGSIMGISLPATYRLYRNAIKKLQNSLNGV